MERDDELGVRTAGGTADGTTKLGSSSGDLVTTAKSVAECQRLVGRYRSSCYAAPGIGAFADAEVLHWFALRLSADGIAELHARQTSFFDTPAVYVDDEDRETRFGSWRLREDGMVEMHLSTQESEHIDALSGRREAHSSCSENLTFESFSEGFLVGAVPIPTTVGRREPIKRCLKLRRLSHAEEEACAEASRRDPGSWWGLVGRPRHACAEPYGEPLEVGGKDGKSPAEAGGEDAGAAVTRGLTWSAGVRARDAVVALPPFPGTRDAPSIRGAELDGTETHPKTAPLQPGTATAVPTPVTSASVASSPAAMPAGSPPPQALRMLATTAATVSPLWSGPPSAAAATAATQAQVPAALSAQVGTLAAPPLAPVRVAAGPAPERGQGPARLAARRFTVQEPCNRQLWVVVAGEGKGGILVRTSESTTSKMLSERLSTGATIEELGVVGNRLHYKRITGHGPDSGWVSISLSEKKLVERCPEK